MIWRRERRRELLLVRVSLPESLRKWDTLLANISDARQISED